MFYMPVLPHITVKVPRFQTLKKHCWPLKIQMKSMGSSMNCAHDQNQSLFCQNISIKSIKHLVDHRWKRFWSIWKKTTANGPKKQLKYEQIAVFLLKFFNQSVAQSYYLNYLIIRYYAQYRQPVSKLHYTNWIWVQIFHWENACKWNTDLEYILLRTVISMRVWSHRHQCFFSCGICIMYIFRVFRRSCVTYY